MRGRLPLQMPLCRFPPPRCHFICVCVCFVLNHLPFIHVEVKLLASQGCFFFSDSYNKARELESSETGTMTGMKIILIEVRCVIYFSTQGAPSVIRFVPAKQPCGQRNTTGPGVNSQDIPGRRVFKVVPHFYTAQMLGCFFFVVFFWYHTRTHYVYREGVCRHCFHAPLALWKTIAPTVFGRFSGACCTPLTTSLA